MVRRLYVSITWSIFAFTVAQFQLAEPWGKVALGKTDVPRITVEFAAVHHAVGVGNLGSAAFVCTGDGGIFCWSNTQLQHLAVAFEIGVDAVAVAVFVVGGFVVGNIAADVAVFAADSASSEPSRRSLLPAVTVALTL